MKKYMTEKYDTFNTKGCPNELIFGDFIDPPIPSEYYNLLNNDDYDGNNIPGTPVDDSLLNNKGVEDAGMKNDDGIKYEIIIIDDDDSLDSEIEPLQKEKLEI